MTTAPVTTHPVSGPARVTVEAGSGPVEVRATPAGPDGPHVVVHLDGDPDAVARTEVRTSPDAVDVRVPRDGVLLGRGRARVSIRVELPEGSDVEVSTRSGRVTTAGPLASFSASSGSGDVLVDEVSGAVRATTGSGEVGLGAAGSAQVRSGSGRVRVGDVAGALEVATGSGRVEVRAAHGPVVVRSGSGDVALGTTSGDVRVGTGSGDVVVSALRSGSLDVTTASGDVSVGVVEGTAAYLDCSSVSGHLSSGLDPADDPGDASARCAVRARTASGAIRLGRSSQPAAPTP